MNFAEGKGPKQVKANYYPTGQFVTIYGNDGAPTGTPNIANPPYTAIVSGTSWRGGVVGSLAPGLNLQVNGNGTADVSPVMSPGANESVQDLGSTGVTLFANTNFSGSALVEIQGTANRYLDNDDYASTHWNTISGITVNSSGTSYTIGYAASGFPVYNAYRLRASGTTASGIIDWAVAGMFTDISAMRVGINAVDANGNIGQMSIQAPRSLAVQSGQEIDNEALVNEYVIGPSPLTPDKNNDNYIG